MGGLPLKLISSLVIKNDAANFNFYHCLFVYPLENQGGYDERKRETATGDRADEVD